MAQMNLNKGKADLVRTETVKISNSLMAQRIQQFSLTLIGRLMNPMVQRMESLLANLPKIWKLEERVEGADLGQDTFQFNFQTEEDLQGVLRNGPYHFDNWMLSLVRWEPIISDTYPSAINFWVKVSGIPMHFWEAATLQAIGKKVGILHDVDEESGSLFVTINGFNPLIFHLVVPFNTGDEVVASLEYEKLLGFCSHCFRLTHDVKFCPELSKNEGGRGPWNKPLVKLIVQHFEGAWEKPRKFAKCSLDFNSEVTRDRNYQQQRIGESSKSGFRYQAKNQGDMGQQRVSGRYTEGREGPGNVMVQQARSHPPRKGNGPAWPKPLYQAKQNNVLQVGGVLEPEVPLAVDMVDREKDAMMEDAIGASGGDNEAGFSVSSDDLLEDGEYQEDEGQADDTAADDEDAQADTEKGVSETDDDTPQGDAAKSKGIARPSQKKSEGGNMGGGTRKMKKGMVALRNRRLKREDHELELSGHWCGSDRELFKGFVEAE
ncbi:PREDICTED: uncharacterized protein LOC104783456 [Camelina sativa]|uniref:Uncharacterized protein LOC104733519 n=1 Tax=Camelina sativa TaxID=90675 RepID=A0ABM1QRH2_CAMSA|nr:PREDICTED: uncharacterized protein LOC104733519 [Camelina sativa]XP_019089361.1 PREDICTED: uncharacterized protein LOC104733521 [Camelina sativa]XP_019099826.1 PREDICTED: uncharacterized protein LOC104783456 [Camelina sativa]